LYKQVLKEGGITMEKKDKTIVCKDCGAEFVFTVREQEFYEEKGFTNEPTRCKECRDKKKAERNNGRGFNNRNRFNR
jgi:DNA replicative helicase MCM subunit Mcm2 (Cdc46/Mcm family)